MQATALEAVRDHARVGTFAAAAADPSPAQDQAGRAAGRVLELREAWHQLGQGGSTLLTGRQRTQGRQDRRGAVVLAGIRLRGDPLTGRGRARAVRLMTSAGQLRDGVREVEHPDGVWPMDIDEPLEPVRPGHHRDDQAGRADPVVLRARRMRLDLRQPPKCRVVGHRCSIPSRCFCLAIPLPPCPRLLHFLSFAESRSHTPGVTG